MKRQSPRICQRSALKPMGEENSFWILQRREQGWSTWVGSAQAWGGWLGRSSNPASEECFCVSPPWEKGQTHLQYEWQHVQINGYLRFVETRSILYGSYRFNGNEGTMTEYGLRERCLCWIMTIGVLYIDLFHPPCQQEFRLNTSEECWYISKIFHIVFPIFNSWNRRAESCLCLFASSLWHTKMMVLLNSII